MGKTFFITGELQIYECCHCPDCRGGHKSKVKRICEEIASDNESLALDEMAEKYWNDGEKPDWLTVQVREGSMPEDVFMRRLGATELVCVEAAGNGR